MSRSVPVSLSLDGDSLNSAIGAALELGRLGQIVTRSPSVVSDAMLIRQACAVMGGGTRTVRAIVTGRVEDDGSQAAARYHAALQNSGESDVGSTAVRGVVNGSPGALILQALVKANLENVAYPDALSQVDAMWTSPPGPHGVVAAALASGAIAATGAASVHAGRGAALVGAIVLAATGCVGGPWIAPAHLDAASRSAAVQVDRSGAWSEWVRTWCAQLARESARAEAAVAATMTRFSAERSGVRAQARVGMTDEMVLAWMHQRVRVTVRDASTALGLTTPTVGSSVARLEERGLAEEVTGQQRDRVWVASALLDLAAGG